MTFCLSGILRPSKSGEITAMSTSLHSCGTPLAYEPNRRMASSRMSCFNREMRSSIAASISVAVATTSGLPLFGRHNHLPRFQYKSTRCPDNGWGPIPWSGRRVSHVGCWTALSLRRGRAPLDCGFSAASRSHSLQSRCLSASFRRPAGNGIPRANAFLPEARLPLEQYRPRNTEGTMWSQASWPYLSGVAGLRKE